MAITRSTSTKSDANAADPAPPTSPNLITIIDGWMREPQIRAFVLTILAMVLIGLALIVGVAAGAIGAVINAALPSLMTKVIAMTIGTTLGGGAIALARRQRAKRRNRVDTTATTQTAPNS